MPAEVHGRTIESGGKKLLLTIVRDITLRKQAAEELQLRAQILDSATDSIFLHDFNGNFIYVNEAACKAHGYTREQFMQMNLNQVIAPERVGGLEADFQEMRKKGEVVFESVHLRKDGSTMPAEVHGRTIESGGKKLLLTIVRDITLRKQAEAEREALLEDLQIVNRKLGESNRELQDFVYVASHDLREPLRKIASFGALLQDSLTGKLDEDQQENFQFMIDGSNRMQAMVDDLLKYSRVTTRAKPFETVDLNGIIDDLKNLELATTLEETGGTISVPETLPPVNGDSSQLHQLLQNLIANGLKFRRQGVTPQITVSARRVPKKMLHVEVQDNGIGIEEKYHEQIFTMFKRLHSREEYEGTGIGLAVCKKIVNRHGGEIGVQSNSGEGSTFWFTLPRG
jgi:PAS domain S-box-containing protein